MNRTLHIGLVGPMPPPFGGMANQTRQLAELLRGEGVMVSLVQTNSPYRPDWVSRLPMIRAAFRLFPYLFALWQQAGQCDIVHVMANSGWSWHLFAVPAVWIARLRGRPVVVHFHGGEAESFLAKSEQTVRLSMRQTFALIVPSGYLEKVFSRFGMVATVVPNVVDLLHFNCPTTHRANRSRLLVARNLEPIYDNETAIRALLIVRKSHPQCTLTIAGSGPLAESLGVLVKSLGLESAVSFTGRLDKDAMAQAYRNADISINPSLVDNMPISVLESMASGVPVVSTNVGGIPYVLTHEQTGLLVPPKSPEAMARAILRLIGDEILSEKLIHNGLAEVSKYTWKNVWPLLSKVYQRALSDPKQA